MKNKIIFIIGFFQVKLTMANTMLNRMISDAFTVFILSLILIPTLISSQDGGKGAFALYDFKKYLILIIYVLSLLARSRERNKSTYADSSASLNPFSFLDKGENVTVQVGDTAYLHCPIFNLAERQVRGGLRVRDETM